MNLPLLIFGPRARFRPPVRIVFDGLIADAPKQLISPLPPPLPLAFSLSRAPQLFQQRRLSRALNPNSSFVLTN